MVFHPRMQEQLHERLRLEDDFNQALVQEEFFLEFQPIVDLKTTELPGVEALVRWQHPEQGRLMPGQFIPAAEETGQIIELGRWVLEDACRRVQQWRQSTPPAPSAARGQHLGTPSPAWRPGVRGARAQLPASSRKPADR